MTKLFLTGCSGFVGSILLRRLIEEGFDIRALIKPGTAKPQLAADAQCDFVDGDILHQERLSELIQGADILVHCAAIVPDRADDEYTWAVNVEGTRNIVAAANANNVHRLVHVSTDSIYGDGPTIDAREETTINTQYHKEGNYPLSKLEAEKIIQQEWMAAGKDAIILRPCMVYGPGVSSATDVLQEWASAGVKLMVDGGSAKLSILFVNDLVEAIILAIKKPGAVSATYNVSDGHHYTKRKILKSIKKLTGGPKWMIPVPGRPLESGFSLVHGALSIFGQSRLRDAFDPERIKFASGHHTINIDKIVEELGYTPRVLLEEGLKRTFDGVGTIPRSR